MERDIITHVLSARPHHYGENKLYICLTSICNKVSLLTMISNPDHTFLDVNTKYFGNPFQLTFYFTLPTERPPTKAITSAMKMAQRYEVFIGASYDSEYAWISDDKFPYNYITRSWTYI